MAIHGLENNNYPKQIVFYDENRRERRGVAECTPNGSTDYPGSWGIEGRLGVYTFGELYDCYVQQYVLDGTGTSSQNPKRITGFSLANGCKYVYDYYYFGQFGPDPDNYVFSVSGKWVDENGDIITDMGSTDNFQITLSDKYGDTSSHKTVWITPPAISWLDVPKSGVAEAGSFDITPRMIWLKDNASPYDPPTLNQLIPRNNFDNYYATYVKTSADPDVYNDWLDKLNNAGDGSILTPQAPSEDTSEPGGGDGGADYNPYSDPIDFPGLPTGGSAIATGFVRVYTPTANQLRALSAELWGHDFFNTIEKIMNDPMEAMISLHAVPVGIVGGSSQIIRIGNYNSSVSANIVEAQYYTLNCGNISIPEHWASALDYSPYTTVDIFIPFVGVRPLQIDDVMGKVLNLRYNVDILTGSAIAMLKCGDSVLYTYNTQLHSEIPYTMSSYGRLIQSIIGVAGTAIGATAGGAGAIIGSGIGGALGTAMTKHSDISRGGSLGGAVGVMGDFTPYLIIHRPIQSLASDFGSKKGYPSNITATLGGLSGYTVVDKVHLTGIDCTDSERDEIHALLKEGVII